MTIETDGRQPELAGAPRWKRQAAQRPTASLGGLLVGTIGALGLDHSGFQDWVGRARSKAAAAFHLPPWLSQAAQPYVDRLQAWWAPIGRWLYVYSIPYYITSTLLRRIIASNVLGLLILVIGLTYIGRTHALLIEAKRESLATQGEIIARAIAGGAFVDQIDGLRIDPERLMSGDSLLSSLRDDGLSSLEFSLPPDRVLSVLRKLIGRDHNRARVFARDFALVADTDWLLQRGEYGRNASKANAPPRASKDFWTRALQWWLRTDLPIYRDLGSAPGSEYREVPMALSGQPQSMIELSEAGDLIVSVAVPIQRAKQAQGVLLLSTRPGDLDAPIAKEQRLLFLLGAIASLASLAASTLLARTVAGPIKQLTAAAEHVSHNINARQELPDYSSRRDEVGRLFRSFDAMTSALYRRIEASEKFAADVAHELRNPLTAARALAESLPYSRTEEQRQQTVAQIQFELKRLNRLITDVSNASRLDAELARQETSIVDLAAIAEGVVGTFSDILSDRGPALRLERDRPDGIYPVEGHDGRLGQVLTNLIDNAISFSPADGTVTVTLARAADRILLSVEDVGPGIPVDKLEAVFERFYSDRPKTDQTKGKNSGLGLSICREIVKAHGGRIEAQNRYPAGTSAALAPIGARFIVELPAVATGRAHLLKPIARRA